jgi:hypothetical protein
MNQTDFNRLIVNNLNTLMEIVRRSDDKAKEYKIKAYQNAINNLPANIRTKLQQPIAGNSIMSKINHIIEYDEDLPEVRNFLTQNGFKYASSVSQNEDSDHEIQVNPERVNQALSYEESELNTDSEDDASEDEDDDEDDDDEDEFEEVDSDDRSVSNDNFKNSFSSFISSVQTLHKMEKYVYQLNLRDPKVKQLRTMIIDLKESIIKNMK